MGASVHPASTGTAVANRIGTDTAQNCDDCVLIRCSALARRSPPWPSLAELVALLAPPGCLACRCALPRAGRPPVRRLLARAAVAAATAAGAAACPSTAGKRCPAARASFPRAWAPLAYQGVARKLVAALKFRGALAAADLMAAHMAANLPPDLRDRAGRARARPAGRPAAAAARVRPGARARRRARPPHGAAARRLPRAHRPRARARSARAAASGARPDGSRSACAGRRRRCAILVDDVHTTGATLDACARALAAEGTTVRGRDHLRPHAVRGCLPRSRDGFLGRGLKQGCSIAP